MTETLSIIGIHRMKWRYRNGVILWTNQ